MDLTLQPNQRSWCGNVQVPPDKSILQRAILLAAFAQGQSCIRAKVCCVWARA
jgi:5-enolpyruvylshikimate-3-phosphate synthase